MKLQPQPLQHFSSASRADAAASKELTITVDPKQRFQTIDGFGGSITDGTSWLVEAKIPAELREQVMQALFSREHGIALSFLRQPLGASDLSRAASTFDDMPAGQQDPDLKHFSIALDQQYTIPMLKEALKINPAITLMATPWSPPAWMKANGSLSGGTLRDDSYAVFAKYVTKSLLDYKAAGIDFKYMTIQNEPLYSTKDYPGMFVPDKTAVTLVGKFVGPEMRNAGLSTEVLAYDHNWDHPEYPLHLLEDPDAAKYVAGSAMHCYGGDVAAQDGIHDAFPAKGIWLTECSGGTWDKQPALMKTSHLLIESTRHWAKAVSLWGMVLDSDRGPHSGGCGTCRGLVTLDLHGNTPQASYTGDYYALGHASKFLMPGAVRIASDSFGESSLQTVAFQNTDQSIVLLVLNNSSDAKSFRVRANGKELKLKLEPTTLATYMWKP